MEKAAFLKSKFNLSSPEDESEKKEDVVKNYRNTVAKPHEQREVKKKARKSDAEKSPAKRTETPTVEDEGETMGEYQGESHVDLVTFAEEILEERMLHRSEISVRLSWLGKTADGDAYTYLKAQCTGLYLTNIIAITTFKHLQFVDFSDNLLTLDAIQPVTELPYLLLLHADKNKLKSAALKKCKYLQVIIMNNNRISDVENIYQPELSTLELGHNNIKEINFINRMPQLRVLDFRHNFITDISNFNYPILDSLYLAGNKIKDLTGIGNLPSLRLLHVRGNPIRFLTGFEMPLKKLKYLNLRNTKIRTLRQIKRLKTQPALDTLVLTGTFYMGGEGKEDIEAGVVEDDPELRVEVLATLPKLKRLNKGYYTPEERQEAKDLQTQWLEEGEKEEDEEVDEEMAEEQDREDGDDQEDAA